jgi:hypothetical protein
MRKRNPNASRIVPYIPSDGQDIELLIRGTNLSPSQFEIVKQVCEEAKANINMQLKGVVLEDPEEVYVNLNFSETY